MTETLCDDKGIDKCVLIQYCIELLCRGGVIKLPYLAPCVQLNMRASNNVY